jgi:DNA-binding IclR family transcriptional regulator
MTDSDSSRITVPGLERGLRLLQLFSRTRTEIKPTEIAEELEIPRSTVHRLLQTLEELGFLKRSENGAIYALGPAVLTLGFDYLGSLDVVQLSNGVLADLRDETQGSSHLSVRNGTDIIYLSRHASPAALTSNVGVGTSLPAHATVMGRVLLADLSSAELRALYKDKRLQSYNENTPTTLAALERLLNDDRQRGYVISASYFERGISSVAAPIRDYTGRAVAAINVSLIAGVVDDKTFRGAIKDRTLAAAAKISGMMGASLATPKSAPARKVAVK